MDLIKIKCRTCEKEFDAVSEKRLYCGSECRKLFYDIKYGKTNLTPEEYNIRKRLIEEGVIPAFVSAERQRYVERKNPFISYSLSELNELLKQKEREREEVRLAIRQNIAELDGLVRDDKEHRNYLTLHISSIRQAIKYKEIKDNDIKDKGIETNK